MRYIAIALVGIIFVVLVVVAFIATNTQDSRSPSSFEQEKPIITGDPTTILGIYDYLWTDPSTRYQFERISAKTGQDVSTIARDFVNTVRSVRGACPPRSYFIQPSAILNELYRQVVIYGRSWWDARVRTRDLACS